MEKTAVSVKIYNENYVLRTEAPQGDVLAVAELVDQKMQRLAEQKQITDTGRLAVWTALDLAGELYKLKQDYEKLLAAARER